MMKPKDGPAIRDTIILFAAMAALAAGAALLFPSLLSIPFFAYGVLYGSAMDCAGTNAVTRQPSRQDG